MNIFWNQFGRRVLSCQTDWLTLLLQIILRVIVMSMRMKMMVTIAIAMSLTWMTQMSMTVSRCVGNTYTGEKPYQWMTVFRGWNLFSEDVWGSCEHKQLPGRETIQVYCRYSRYYKYTFRHLLRKKSNTRSSILM